MKVCMVSYSEDHDSRVLRYANALVERGDTVHAVCLGRRGQPRVSESDGIHFHRLYSRAYDEKTPFSYLRNLTAFFVRAAAACARLHVKHRFDVVHFHNIPDFGIFCTVVPKWMGAGIILDIHDLVPEFYRRKFGLDDGHPVIRLLKWIEKRSARFADHVITVTELWRETLIRRSVPADKCSVVLNAPDPRYFRPLPSKPRGSRTLFLSYHGNLSEQAGVDLILQALPVIRASRPEVRLRIFGHAEKMQRLRLLARSLGVESIVDFNDSIHVGRLRRELERVDIGIDPKRDGVYSGETLSVKAIEYMALGIPLVASRTKVARMYFDDGMVRFFTPDDPADLARAVINLSGRPSLQSALVRNAFRFVKAHRWSRYRDVYFEVLDRLTNA
jgi:glycosyltransferase involved in cell wall biosynthesis